MYRLVVFRRYRFSRVRHGKPFNKTQRGAQRRAERRFKTEQREADYVELPFNSPAPLFSRREYWRAIDAGLLL